MHRRQWATVAAACTLLLGGMILSQAVDAKKHSRKGEAPTGDTQGEKGPQPPSPVYNPYPPGILPADIDTEIARVLREIDGIEQEALAQLRALPPPVLTGQPPTLQGTGMRLIQLLGKAMNYDKTISPERTSACSSCHMPYVGFSGPIPSVNLTMVAYPGTVHFRAGKRTAQRYTYSPYFPVLHFNETQQLFFGGNFWDSRATGYILQQADAEQAQHPPVDTQEMGNPDTACIAFKLSQAEYRPFFEMAGAQLFDGKGNCNSCHVDGRGTTISPGQTDTSKAATVNPVFTCFGSANEGLPLNPRNAFYYQTTPDPFGFTGNPLGFGYRDLGLGTFLRSGFGSAPNPNSTWTQFAPSVDGQFQVATARDVAMTPSQCPTTEAPGPYFQKEFFHNGYVKSLKQLVHFYNTRDLYSFDVTSGHCPPGTTEKVDCWPRPEVPQNLDCTTGNLGLTDQEENQIVAFLQTLTDGFTT